MYGRFQSGVALVKSRIVIDITKWLGQCYEPQRRDKDKIVEVLRREPYML